MAAISSPIQGRFLYSNMSELHSDVLILIFKNCQESLREIAQVCKSFRKVIPLVSGENLFSDLLKRECLLKIENVTNIVFLRDHTLSFITSQGAFGYSFNQLDLKSGFTLSTPFSSKSAIQSITYSDERGYSIFGKLGFRFTFDLQNKTVEQISYEGSFDQKSDLKLELSSKYVHLKNGCITLQSWKIPYELRGSLNLLIVEKERIIFTDDIGIFIAIASRTTDEMVVERMVHPYHSLTDTPYGYLAARREGNIQYVDLLKKDDLRSLKSFKHVTLYQVTQYDKWFLQWESPSTLCLVDLSTLKSKKIHFTSSIFDLEVSSYQLKYPFLAIALRGFRSYYLEIWNIATFKKIGAKRFDEPIEIALLESDQLIVKSPGKYRIFSKKDLNFSQDSCTNGTENESLWQKLLALLIKIVNLIKHHLLCL